MLTIATLSPGLQDSGRSITAISAYWNDRIHDMGIATYPVGTASFFDQLDTYRFDKLRYLSQIVDSPRYRGKTLLEVGCGIGIDLVHFAQTGAVVTGVDLSQVAIDLARQNFAQKGLEADLHVMNGEALEFSDDSFDVVYAHGVLQYTAAAPQMVAELHRVLRPGGVAIVMVYNKYSWLNALSKLMRVELEHEDAPVLMKYTIAQFRSMLQMFAKVRIEPERFPVESRLHRGMKGTVYNRIFVKAFSFLPRSLVRPLGWHLMAIAQK